MRYGMQIFALALALASTARAEVVCAGLFASSNEIVATQALNQDPGFLTALAKVVAGSQFRSEIQHVEGFNDRIISANASELEKLVRQETPYTVSLIGRDVINHANRLGRFSQFGLVIGDPHFGNFNIQPILFQAGQKDQNRYTVVDLDEVSIGVFSLDFARYTIFLKARFGDLSSHFGSSFVSELFEAYNRGLQHEASPAPEFIVERLRATSAEIRKKVDDYADKRVDSKGKFHTRDFEQKELLEFEISNMKPDFISSLRFDSKVSDHDGLKKSLIAFFEQSVRAEMGSQVELLDIAIPLRDSGGSALRQRFLVSAVVTQDGVRQRVILEFKENAPQNAWQAVIKAPLTAAERYELGLSATMPNPGRFLRVVDFEGKTSFLMRARGNLDVEAKKRPQLRELALYNAYMMGLFHGSQGAAVSGSYRQDVGANRQEFQDLVLGMTDKVLSKLVLESGLRIPR
jgi:hypothetical protein